MKLLDKLFDRILEKRMAVNGVEPEGMDDIDAANNEENHEEKPSTDKYSQSDPKESTRSLIAQIYVCAFFIVIGVVFLIGWYSCFAVDDYKDMLVTVSGILSGPLGFIVGYYFKASSE